MTESTEVPVGAGQRALSAAELPPDSDAAAHIGSLYRLGDTSLSELSLEPLLDEILARLQEVMGIDTVAVLLLDERGRRLEPRASRGLEADTEPVAVALGRGFAGRIAASRRPIFIADVANADVVNPVLREAGVSSLLGVPLVVEGKLLGVLHVGTLEPREFTEVDATVLAFAATRVAPAIERAQLLETLERQHQGALALQRSLLPDRMPTVLGVEVATRYLPSRDEVGGDWYDVIELRDGLVGIAIGDVAGHGVRAAALMGQLRTGLRAYALDEHPPGETLARLDRLLNAMPGGGMATAVYAILDPDAGTLTLATAGHLPPLLVGPDGARFGDVPPAPPLGVVRGARYRETTLDLGSDTLLLYTDGLVERRGERLDAGLDRLAAAAEAGGRAEQLCHDVAERLVPIGGAEDDVALLAVRVPPLGERFELRVPAVAGELAAVRRVLRRWLRFHDADADAIAAITLAVGEACANVVEHAYGPVSDIFEVTGSNRDGDVLIAVQDHGRWLEKRRGRNRGRGLDLMRRTMDEVTVEHGNTGSVVTLRRHLRGSR
jgi:anti-sigma regulatory factor (Ser/Thr protein kinase)/putative methionine-R-sulfoxide reductase with GAF domain